jgi:hypothetical protein
MTPATPKRATLDRPTPFLRWLAGQPKAIPLGAINPAEMWSLVALATLARSDGPAPLRVTLDAQDSAGFAFAVGLEEVTQGRQTTASAEPVRTVRLSRIDRTAPTEPTEPTEPTADRISRLLLHESENTRRTIYYVLNELLRNVVQHSQDPLGGVIGAQVNDGGRNAGKPMVQVASRGRRHWHPRQSEEPAQAARKRERGA